MKKDMTGPAITGIIAVVVLVLAILGYRYLSGPRQGEKPQLDPVLNRMYGPHPVGSNLPASQGKPNTSGQTQ